MLTSEQARQNEADMIADAIGTCFEVNREFVESCCSEDVRDMLFQLSDERDMSEALVNSLRDAREWGIYVAPSSVIILVGEIEEQFEGSPGEFFAEPDEWTIDGNLAYLTMESVRIAVDMETLREEVAERLPAITERDRRTFLSGYWGCVDFTASDSEGEPIDCDSRHELPAETVAEMEADALDFLQAQWVWLHSCDDLSNAGHDFHLTRNHHGAGFWDGDWGELGGRLTEAAHTYGSCEVYQFDDGSLDVME
jgi:hypothetical protein